MNYKPKVWQELNSEYQEITPDVRLRAYIQTYWLSYSDKLSGPTRIIPDLCSDLIVQLSPELDLLSIKICGPNTGFFYSRVEQPTVYFGIRYFLGGMYPFLNSSCKGLKNQLVELDIVEKNMANDMKEKLSGKKSFDELVKSLDLYFINQLNRLEFKLLSPPVHEFIDNHCRPIKMGISERSLQRLFREETGLSPYEAFDVLRFQKIYQELMTYSQINHLDLVEKYDFFDQAHYSRKMKKMTGLTPQEICRHVGILQDKI